MGNQGSNRRWAKRTVRINFIVIAFPTFIRCCACSAVHRLYEALAGGSGGWLPEEIESLRVSTVALADSLLAAAALLEGTVT